MTNSTSNPPVLNYAGPVDPPALPPACEDINYCIALVCWWFPLLLGVAVFLGFLVLRDESMFALGAIVILIGVFCSMLGLICALIFLITRCRRSSQPRVEAVRPTIILVLLLASNYGVALALGFIASLIAG